VWSWYNFWVFLHLLGVFGFLTAHGVVVGVAFALRRERDPARIRTLLELSGSSMMGFYVSLLVLLAGGFAATGYAHFWDQTWMWIALGLLIFMSALMSVMVRPYYRRIRKVMGIQATGSTAVGAEEIEAVMGSGRPMIVAGLGIVTLIAILYLMVMKPFT
jgi:Predicted integral membrane protein (DUF2269)